MAKMEITHAYHLNHTGPEQKPIERLCCEATRKESMCILVQMHAPPSGSIVSWKDVKREWAKIGDLTRL
jgi:hypothetical protein